MAGEHGSSCCNHDDPQATRDDRGERHQATQPTSTSTITASGCCGGASDHEMSLSKPHAEHPSAPATS